MTLADSHSLVSVIVPVGERQSPMADLYAEYKSGLQLLGSPYELIFVLDGEQPTAERVLLSLVAMGEPITIVYLTRYFGEATSLMIGFDHAAGDVIVTLPAYLQVEGCEIGKLVAGLGASDIVVGYREPRASSWFQRLRHRVFHGLLRFVTRLNFRDLGCNVRALKRKVLEEVHLYGDQQRFLPLLAERQGFRVGQVAVRQSKADRREEMYRPRNYTRGLLDIFNVFFLIRFTKKPLRFFGMIGVAIFSLGILELMYLIFDRIYFHHPLADRPALLLASLMIVLGVQMFALGLLGELIIFTHAGGSKDYKVDRVIQYTDAPPALPESADAAEKLLDGAHSDATSSLSG
jgi:glycosyltransferase involved in cell wall biosynthesis